MTGSMSALGNQRIEGEPSARNLLQKGLDVLSLQLILTVSAFVTTLIAARVLEVKGLGFFVSLQAIGILSVAIWDIGISAMTIRELATNCWPIQDFLRSALKTRVLLAPLWLASASIGLFFLHFEEESWYYAAAIMVVASGFTGMSLLTSACLQSMLRFRHIAFASLASRFAFVVISVAILVTRPMHPIVLMTVGYLIGEVLLAVLQSFFLRRLLNSVSSSNTECVTAPGPKTLIRWGFPYAFNGLSNLIYNRMDVIIVTILAGPVQAGLYTPASRIQDGLITLPATASMALVPFAARMSSSTNGSNPFKRMTSISVFISLGLTIPAVVVAIIAAGFVVPRIFGGDYHNAVTPIRIIVLSLPFIAFAQPLFSVINGAGHARKLNYAYGAGLVVAVGGHIVLDPRFGAQGAAIATVIRDATACMVGVALYLRLNRTKSQPNDAQLSSAIRVRRGITP